jgi:hypothetical protein
MSEEMLLDSARFGILEGLMAGITTYADTCSSGVAMRAMNEMGVRGIMYQEVFGPDPSQADDAMRELEDRIAKLLLEQTDLVGVGVSPHAPYTVSDRLYGAAASFANSRRLPMAMHIAESEAEFELVANGRGEFADRWERRPSSCSTGRERSIAGLSSSTACVSTMPTSRSLPAAAVLWRIALPRMRSSGTASLRFFLSSRQEFASGSALTRSPATTGWTFSTRRVWLS